MKMSQRANLKKRLTSVDIIVFSHLNWDYVYQRPQQILSRLSKHHRILFIEQPVDFVSLHRIPNIIEVSENIIALQPRIKHENFLDEYEELVKVYAQRFDIKNPILWFYGPGYEKLSNMLEHSLIVYDCMDEHTAFKNAYSEGLVQNERNLLSKADVVFTGGKSLYEAKKSYTKNIYCFPSSVDTNHFEKALKDETEIPEELLQIPEPRVGYYAVIDERADLKLLQETAKIMPGVSFIMIGPVSKGKVAPEDIPHEKNIYWLGGKPYEDLPKYLKGLNICMMPFALNESTKFISPTKTLEYMAALKPIISTPVKDVTRDYSDTVSIVSSSKEFSKAIEKLLNESTEEKERRKSLQRKVIESTSWDKTVDEMELILTELLIKKRKKTSEIKNEKTSVTKTKVLKKQAS
jgi:glycosyltransferase involved in cell wall biosynthesis